MAREIRKLMLTVLPRHYFANITGDEDVGPTPVGQAAKKKRKGILSIQ
jgi:hypothetical protein